MTLKVQAFVDTDGRRVYSEESLTDFAATTVRVRRAIVAGAAIPANRLVELTAAGAFVKAPLNSLRVVGGLLSDVNVDQGANTYIGSGYDIDLVAAAPLVTGCGIKAADNGRVCQHVDAALTGSTIKQTAAGSAFGNQPANDTVTIVSSSASDTQTATIIGTTNGGVVVVTEDVVLTGTTPVDTVKTDWGVILAVKLSSAAVGTVTIKEKSGGLTITTITAAASSKGVNAVAAASQGAHNVIPTAVGSDTTTKTIGIQYTQTDGSTVAYQAVALNNTTAAAFGTAALLVTEVYSGDLEGTRTATVAVGAEEDENRRCGRAMESQATVGEVAACAIWPR